MKIKNIIDEDTYENVTIIENIVDYILDIMPDSIPENSTYGFGYFARGGNSGNDWLKDTSDSDIKSIKDLLKENENNPKIKIPLEFLVYNKIIFHNTEKYINHSAAGDYSWGPINIYVSTIQKSTREFIIKYTEEKSLYPSFNIQRFKRVLTHEIRHLFQDMTYQKYMRKKDRDLDKKTKTIRPWEKRQIEWDAKWTDIIYEYNPEDYSNINEYINVVMDEFEKWVTIPKKIQEHYKRKTASYYLKRNNQILENVWNKTIEIYKPKIINGDFTRDEIIEIVFEELSWYINNRTGIFPEGLKHYYKMKTIKKYEELTINLKKNNKIKTYIEKYKQEYNTNLQNFLNANYNRIKDINTYGAASAIVNKLRDDNPDFFYNKKKNIYDISFEVNKHYYKQTVEYIKYLKDMAKGNE